MNVTLPAPCDSDQKGRPSAQKDVGPGNMLADPSYARDRGSAGISGTQLSHSALPPTYGGSQFSCGWLSSLWERKVGLRVQVLRRKLPAPVVPLDGGGRITQRNETIMNGGY